MKIMRDESLPSGYQHLPPVPPSVGRALSVLIAVCAVLWVWLMLPQWWLLGDASQQNLGQVGKVVFDELVVWPLISALNILLLLYATRPMWRGERSSPSEEAKRGFVLLLCLLFHILTPPFALLLVVAITMD